MQTGPPKPTPIREIDFSHYIKHYFYLLWRWKWWITITGPIVSILALIYMVKIAPVRPELTATTLIGMENTTRATAMMDFIDVDNSMAELMETRNFLKDIVSRLSLQFVLKKYTRDAVFDTIQVDSVAPLGRYNLMIDSEDRGTYSITFTNRRMGINKKVVAGGKLVNLRIMKMPGVLLKFSRQFLKDPHTVTFYIIDMPKAIETLHSNITIIKPDIRRQLFHIEVSLKGRDYNHIASVLNTIADAFVEKKLMFQRRKTQNVVEVLEKQYDKAQMGLSTAQGRLRYFRTANPMVGLTASAQQTVNNLSELETNAFSIKSSRKEASELLSKYRSASKEDQTQVAEEILVFLNSQDNTSAPVLQVELNRLLAEKRALQYTYSETHPFIKENEAGIEKIISKIDIALVNFIKNTEEQEREKSSGIKELSAKLQRLPSKELQLAELERQHHVNAETHSRVADRYNQAKVAETIEIADTYVMDYAAPPIQPPVDLMKLLGICLLLGLSIAFGPPVLSDMISKTVRTEFELQKMTGIPVLETIPRISTVKRRKE